MIQIQICFSQKCLSYATLQILLFLFRSTEKDGCPTTDRISKMAAMARHLENLFFFFFFSLLLFPEPKGQSISNLWYVFGLARRGSTIGFHLLWHTVELAMSTRRCYYSYMFSLWCIDWVGSLYANRIFMYFCIKSSIGTQGEAS